MFAFWEPRELESRVATRARYRIQPQVGTLRLFNGPYTLALAANSVSQGAAGYLTGQELGTFNMTFA